MFSLQIIHNNFLLDTNNLIFGCRGSVIWNVNQTPRYLVGNPRQLLQYPRLLPRHDLPSRSRLVHYLHTPSQNVIPQHFRQSPLNHTCSTSPIGAL